MAVWPICLAIVVIIIIIIIIIMMMTIMIIIIMIILLIMMMMKPYQLFSFLTSAYRLHDVDVLLSNSADVNNITIASFRPCYFRQGNSICSGNMGMQGSLCALCHDCFHQYTTQKRSSAVRGADIWKEGQVLKVRHFLFYIKGSPPFLLREAKICK